MADENHPNCVAVDAVLRAAGAAGRVRGLPEPAPTAPAAAAQLGVAVGAIANSLIFTTDAGEQVLVLASGGHRVDTTLVAQVLDVGSVRRASPEEVRAATGQPIGGVAPVGHPGPLRTLIDEDLRGYPEIWAAGGVPETVFPTSFEELARISAATETRVAADSVRP
jgi:prolyl-tRNA editing enzyme YbaK/EbsC (Cys-tRNA(Pro) deacylase)